MKNKLSAPTAKKMKVQVSESPVYETENYDLFGKILGNRPISATSYQRLLHKIQNLNLLRCFPIVVNKKMEVIDGQHRLKVATEIGSPIFFIIEDDADIHHTREVNTVGSQWSQTDFLNNFIELDIKSYIELKKFREENANILSMPEAIFMFTGKKGEQQTHFRKGEMVVGDIDLREKTMSFLNKLYTIRRDAAQDTYLQRIIYYLITNEVVSMSRLMEMFEKHPDKLAYLPKSEARMFAYLDEIYNFGLKNYVSIREKKPKFVIAPKKINKPRVIIVKTKTKTTKKPSIKDTEMPFNVNRPPIERPVVPDLSEL